MEEDINVTGVSPEEKSEAIISGLAASQEERTDEKETEVAMAEAVPSTDTIAVVEVEAVESEALTSDVVNDVPFGMGPGENYELIQADSDVYDILDAPGLFPSEALDGTKYSEIVMNAFKEQVRSRYACEFVDCMFSIRPVVEVVRDFDQTEHYKIAFILRSFAEDDDVFFTVGVFTDDMKLACYTMIQLETPRLFYRNLGGLVSIDGDGECFILPSEYYRGGMRTLSINRALASLRAKNY